MTLNSQLEYVKKQTLPPTQKKTSEERREILMKILQERKEAFNILAKC